MKAAVLLCCLGVAMSAVAQSNEKAMPAMVVNARWVQVRAMTGDEYAVNVTSEDRAAIREVQKRLQDWGRYRIAHKQQDAEIIVVVRRGRLASAKPGVIIDMGSGRPVTPGIGVSSDVGPKEDMLAVHDAQLGIDSPPLWRRLQTGGLLNEMPLFKQFKREVEAAKP